MELAELARAAGPNAEIRGGGETPITALAYDSRAVVPGSLFFCVRGMQSDGHEFAPAAIEAGAAALVVERPLALGVPELVVEDARAAMAPLASAFHGDPTAELTMVGITGTNGKTTTAFLVRDLLEAAGRRCGLLGTVQRVVGGKVEEVERTTPEAVDLQATFARMLEAGDEACVMEVSSHALVLHRADAIRFDAKVFTNLTQDHLDFHRDMEDYFGAKRLLFTAEGGAPTLLLEGGVSVLNVDDPYGRRLAADLSGGGDDGGGDGDGGGGDDGGGGECLTYSAAGAEADFSARGVVFDAAGSRFECLTPHGHFDVSTPLPGHFNVENALAALATAEALGLELSAAARALASAGRVPGRFEPIDEGQPFAVLVDYAHTPDSLVNVLKAAREITPRKLIVVFGCGGDRDREKRPIMGRDAATLADLAVITSDNPRSEDPQAIIEDILEGIDWIREQGAKPTDPVMHGTDGEVWVDVDRRRAISRALEAAEPGDAVVIAGKGHEQGQEFEHGRKIPFDDRHVAREELRAPAAGAAR